MIPIVTKTKIYQKFLIAYMTIAWVLTTWVLMIGAYVFMNPLFMCDGEYKTEKEACTMIDQCRIENDFTATYFNGLYCDRQN